MILFDFTDSIVNKVQIKFKQLSLVLFLYFFFTHNKNQKDLVLTKGLLFASIIGANK